ncbi:nagb/rpia/CoA transferase-like protein [Dothidotthia symphoricarpi CBS 119687]|uniref:5-formyltetrahydrofolate cyclo-ligase n=1 Tax=Dothidotthia symphoricarpi CBS 119687 TaxID=1392245 RepID=A0A6A6A1E6_9PLEO|nr:nagb/rpia/CoA transferase-like protein [Dothidotthia symphoricarpi CBS 119687]KAF2124984.1 nagb/rpia/CoA transferase-like protein [Dothidotthia symphoricarpi CBS 119687]
MGRWGVNECGCGVEERLVVLGVAEPLDVKGGDDGSGLTGITSSSPTTIIMAGSLAAVKKELRKKIKNVLKELPEAAAVTQTSKATKTLLAMPEYQAARRISVYLSMPSGEISTSSIVRDALAQGKQVFIPYTFKLSNPEEGQPESIMDMVELRSMHDFESLQPDKWGIPTPDKDGISSRANCFGSTGITQGETPTSSRKESLDLIVMPGMAFDSKFGRLGHGKGFYDYFLTRCHQSSRMPFRVGLSLTEQFLPQSESVPMDSSDFRLDALITGDGEIRRA